MMNAGGGDLRINFRRQTKILDQVLRTKMLQRSFCRGRLVADEELMKDLNRLKEIWAHALPKATWHEVIHRAVKIAIEKEDKLKKAGRALARIEGKRCRPSQSSQGQNSLSSLRVSQGKRCQKNQLEKCSQKSEAGNQVQNDVRDQAPNEARQQGMPAHQRQHDHQGHRGCNVHQSDQSSQGQSASTKADSELSPSLGRGSIYSPDPIEAPLCRTVSRSREVRADGYPTFSVSHPVASRRIASATRHFVWARDAGQCTYISPDGTRCESRYGLELDHQLPYAMGGDNSPGNLRLRCKSHNCLHAIESYGREKISRHLQPR
jgi:hypothetical protein